MKFPLDIWDVSLLLAIVAVILIVTSVSLSTPYGKANILVNRKRLKNAAIAVSILFLATLVIRIASIILD